MSSYAEGRILQINVSRGGVPKLPAPQAFVTFDGLAGDDHYDKRDHGGPMRAVCLFTVEEIQRLAAEGHDIFPGATGENVTLTGIPLTSLTPGVRVALGEMTLIEVTGYAAPCKTIKKVFSDGDFTRISAKLHPGESRVYARVVREGLIQAGDVARIVVADDEAEDEEAHA